MCNKQKNILYVIKLADQLPFSAFYLIAFKVLLDITGRKFEQSFYRVHLIE